MCVRVIGPHPLANDDAGRAVTRIATVFPYHNTVVTMPGIHATQRLHFLDFLAQEHARQGLAPLTRQQEQALSDDAVDVVREDQLLLIRPDAGRMPAAVAADEVLQQLVPNGGSVPQHVGQPRTHGYQRRGSAGTAWTRPQPRKCWQLVAASHKAIGLVTSPQPRRHRRLQASSWLGRRTVLTRWSKSSATRRLPTVWATPRSIFSART
jgi:hypothetical protein